MTGGKPRPATSQKRQDKSLINRQVWDTILFLRGRKQVASRDSANNLSRWLSHLSTGSSADLRTPFFAKAGRTGKTLEVQDRSTIIAQFNRLYASTKQMEQVGEPIRGLIDEFESDHVKDIGVMSAFRPWAVDGPAKAKAVFTDKSVISGFNHKAWANAVSRVASLVPTGSCKFLSVEEAIHGTKNDPEGGLDTTTNSGLPWVCSPWKPHDELPMNKRVLAEECFKWYVSEVKGLYPFLRTIRSDHELPYWYALVGQRLVQKGSNTQGPKRKRIIEAYPKHEAILAKIATTEMMNEVRKYLAPSGNRLMCSWFDQPTIDSNMQLILKEAHDNGRTVLSGDISSFDATIPPWVLWDVACALSTWTECPAYVKNLMRMMIYRTILVTPTGCYGPGPSSMKSGSGFTNLLGSMSNLALLLYGEEAGHYKIHSIAVQGDDLVMDGDGAVPESIEFTLSHFGMEAHPDKQWFKPGSLQYLKRLHLLGRPGGIASVYRTLGSVLSLERMQLKSAEWNKYAYVVQALSRLQNATFNPCFETLVRFIQSGDKIRLGAEMTVHELTSGAGKAGEIIMREQVRHSWKDLGDQVSFDQWTVNGVVRGEELPLEPSARFRRVYGKDPGTV